MRAEDATGDKTLKLNRNSLSSNISSSMDSSEANEGSESQAAAVDDAAAYGDLERLLAIAKWFFLASAAFVVLFCVFHLLYEYRFKRKRKEESREDDKVPFFEIKYRYRSQAGKEGANLMVDPYRYGGQGFWTWLLVTEIISFQDGFP